MVEFTLQALHDEIENDLQAIGYKVDEAWKEDSVIVDLINAKNYTIDQASVPMEIIRSATYYDAYDTLAIDEQEWLRWITPNGGDLRVTADVKTQLTGRSLTVDGVAGSGNDDQSFWAAAHDQDMAPAMLALIEVLGSRAEVLWGANIVISIGQVGHAANL